MNRLHYMGKYLEYIVKVARTFIISEESFHTQRLRAVLDREPNLINPMTLNEKVCYRLIHDRNPLYTALADKLTVREYVSARASDLLLVPLIDVYRQTKDIDFSVLPDRFVLKCNHDSGSAVICVDKRNFNYRDALLKLYFAMKKNMYYSTREWQYKDIKSAIICEEYIDLFAAHTKEYTPEMLRIHCFDGTACFIEADFTDESGKEYINVYDRTWTLQPFQMEFPNNSVKIPEPKMFYQSLYAAQALSKGIDYCRVDLMLQEDRIYFSEITLTPCRGKIKITPMEWDLKLGNMWKQKTYHN